MNNKILIGSIIAICILIGVSFTSVVGYRSVDSDVNASPLFNIRTSRAIDEDNQDFTCEYVGKGKESILSFPQRNNRIEMVQKIVKSINRMSDETFEKMIASFIDNIRRNPMFDYDYPKDVKEALHLVRSGDKSIILFNADIENNYQTSGKIATMCPTCFCITTDYGIKGFLYCIFLIFYRIILSLESIIDSITYVLNCDF